MKLRYLGTILLFVIGISQPAVATATAGPEVVTQLTQTASLRQTGELTQSTEIDYDFGSSAPHDITFSIPLSYHDDQGREYRMAFKLTEAKLDGKTIPLSPVTTTEVARFILPSGPATALSTRHYSLAYSLLPVVLRGGDADILKLSVTGLGWAVPINRSSVRLESSTAPADSVTCFTGAQGSTTGACSVDQQGKVANVVSYSALVPGESLSIFCDFPRGSFASYLKVYENHPTTPAVIIISVISATIIIVVLLITGIRYFKRRRAARDL